MKTFFFVVLLCLSNQLSAQPEYIGIVSSLKKLKPLIGTWAVTTQMISRNGTQTTETGDYKIAWDMDSTYLVWNARLKSEKGRTRTFRCFLTFDAKTNAYKVTYLYGKTAFQVFESGELVDNKLRTTTTLDINGKREFIRTELDISKQDRMTFRSWSRYEDESNEILDFIAEMARARN